MQLETMIEIEACIKDIPALTAIPILWGVNPGDHSQASARPFIGIYAQAPTEHGVFVSSCEMVYQIKIGYYDVLQTEWPTSKEALAVMQEKALLVRKAVRRIYQRQTEGLSSATLTIESDVDQEISILGSLMTVGTILTITEQESV
jgi:hypothetical protein